MAEKMRPIYDYSVLYHLGVIESAFPRNKGVKAALGMVRDVVNSAPTVSPDEVRGVGKWDRVETEFGLRCPKCGKLLDEYVNGGEWVALSEIPNYCPNCGAKMEVSE